MTKVWGDDGDAVLSRYNRGCPPYQINHDRFGSSNILDGSRIQQNSRGYSVPSHDQKSDIDSEEHGKGNPRRRIPVAVRYISHASVKTLTKKFSVAVVGNEKFDAVALKETPAVRTARLQEMKIANSTE
jgi:hypothetical protein